MNDMPWKMIHKEEPMAADGTSWSEELAFAGGADPGYGTWHVMPNRPTEKTGLCPERVVCYAEVYGASGAGTIQSSVYLAYGDAKEHSWRCQGFPGADNYNFSAAPTNGPSNSQLFACTQYSLSRSGGDQGIMITGDWYRIRWQGGGTLAGTVRWWFEFYAMF